MAHDGSNGNRSRKREGEVESRTQAPDSTWVWRMSELTRDKAAEPYSRDQILRRERLATNPDRLMANLLKVMAMFTLTQSWCGPREDETPNVTCSYRGWVPTGVLLGYLYPALASAKAAVQQDTAGYTQWMTYWVVMSVFALGEVLVDFFVSWVPFYFEAKIVLIVWLTLPRYQGASQIYRRFLHPYFEHYEGDIDSHLEGMRVEATRRIQSLGASAANEIAKAVTRQGFSAKEQILARVLGMAAGVEASTDAVGSSSTGQTSASQNNRQHDFVYEAEDVQQPGRRDEGGRMGNGMEAEEEEEDVAAVKASMLRDFKEVMKGGVFVEARSSLAGEDGYGPWSHGEIMLVKDRVFSMVLDSEEIEKRFEVCAVAPSSTDRSSLLLRTDKGRVDLSLAGDEDRDSILAGFELLLSSNEFGGQPVPAASGAKADELLNERTMAVERRKSRQWEPVPRQGSGMVMESGDEGEETEEDHDSASPKVMPRLSHSSTGTE